MCQSAQQFPGSPINRAQNHFMRVRIPAEDIHYIAIQVRTRSHIRPLLYAQIEPHKGTTVAWRQPVPQGTGSHSLDCIALPVETLTAPSKCVVGNAKPQVLR